ncbi:MULTISPECIES: hypothetical protein [Haloferacaceae]|uniref:CARDB domain-containing protein n=1 Tax=Halorubrum glutamatedens TaxID=2707018 RepID=A0ABD5QTC6_9EURY|nr:hypothetical protein [Halobellus captivus]
MNRRKYLAISGGLIALAGCSGETDNKQSEEEPEEENQESDPEPEPEPDPPNFEIQSVGESGYINYHPQNPNVDFSMEVQNTGEQRDTQTVEFRVEEVTQTDDEISLGGEDSRIVDFYPNLADGNSNIYEYSYHTEDDEQIGGEVYIFECPSKEDIIENEPISARDISIGDTRRFEFDVRIFEEGDSYDDSELISLGKKAVCTATEEDSWNAISVTLWEEDQIPGYEQAYGECIWAPNGIWSQAGEVEAGEYMEHEYSVNRF